MSTLDEIIQNEIIPMAVAKFEFYRLPGTLLLAEKSDGKTNPNAYLFHIGSSFMLYLSPNATCEVFTVKLKEDVYNSVCADFPCKRRKSAPLFVFIKFVGFSQELKDIMASVFEYYIEGYAVEEPFGCCGKYLACSDAGRCLHDDELHSRACVYKANLEKGLVFYGERRNID